mgnify:FL=1|tara:strand:+ start:29 stop:1486 length:1458 start_codon:yes stop_codon:yes gene_type:complete
MLRFKTYVRYLEEAVLFSVNLTPAEWDKRPERFDKLRTAMKDKIKIIHFISKTNQREMIVKDTTDNKKIIKDFEKVILNTRGPARNKALKELPTIDLDTSVGKVPITSIAKSLHFGGEPTGGGMSGATAKGESLQCVMLDALLKHGTNKKYDFFTQQNILETSFNNVKVDKKFKDIMEAVTRAPQWHRSGFMIGKKLIKEGYVTKDHELFRGKDKMNEIYKLKKNAYSAEGKPELRNDKWNPGDIYAIRKSVDIKKTLQDHSIAALNISLSEAFRKRDIVPISLKIAPEFKDEGSIKLTVYNLDRIPEKQRKFNRLTLAKRKFWGSKSATLFIDGQQLDFRSFSDFVAVNMEILGGKARGGKVGYNQQLYAAKEFLRAKNLPDNGKIVIQARKIHTELSSGKIGADTKKFWSMVQETDTNIKEEDFYAYPKARKAADVHSKLAATYVCHAMMKANNKQRDQFATNVFNIASSQTADSSVYVKAFV